MDYELDGVGEDTWITFKLHGQEVDGYLNVMIADGGVYHSDGENFTEFNQATLDWLEGIDENRPE